MENETFCVICHGRGLDNNDKICGHCEGTGIEPMFIPESEQADWTQDVQCLLHNHFI